MRAMTLAVPIVLLLLTSGCIANMGELKTALGVIPPPAPAPVYDAPHAKAQANTTLVKVEQPVRFAAEGSKDPQDLPLAYTWSFSDGSLGQGAEVTHAFLRAGEYKVVLTVTNAQGLADTDSVTVQVAQGNRAPSAALAADAPSALSLASNDGALHVLAGDKVAFDSGKSTDPDGDALLAAWDFGDGQTGVGATQSHAFADPGLFTVKLRVTDPSGASSDATRFVAVSWSKTYNGSFELGADATKAQVFPVAAGARSLAATLTFDAGGVNDLVLVVKDAAGKEVARSASGMPAPGASGPVTRTLTLDAAKLAGAAPGAWSAEVVKNGGLQVAYTLSLSETL